MAHITNYTLGCAGLGDAGRGTSGQGTAWHGEVWHGVVLRGMARLQGEIPALCSNGIIMTNYAGGEARFGWAMRGAAGQSWARHGQQELCSCFIFNFHILYSRQGLAVHGWVWRGMAWRGNARQGHRASKPCALCVKSDLHGEKRKN